MRLQCWRWNIDVDTRFVVLLCRVIPNRRSQPKAFRLYLELIGRYALSFEPLPKDVSKEKLVSVCLSLILFCFVLLDPFRISGLNYFNSSVTVRPQSHSEMAADFDGLCYRVWMTVLALSVWDHRMMVWVGAFCFI